jgi:hypothetical protein
VAAERLGPHGLGEEQVVHAQQLHVAGRGGAAWAQPGQESSRRIRLGLRLAGHEELVGLEGSDRGAEAVRQVGHRGLLRPVSVTGVTVSRCCRPSREVVR